MGDRGSVPDCVPEIYKEKLTRFIKGTGGVFWKMYYKPRQARIVDSDNLKTIYIVNLENGEIYVPKNIVRKEPIGNLSAMDY